MQTDIVVSRKQRESLLYKNTEAVTQYFTLVVRVSVRLPYVRPYLLFQVITWVNGNRFSPNLVCALTLWISGLGLLVDKFR